MTYSHRRSSAFTLTELLVVVALVAILATLILPVVTIARKGADNAKCISNLRELVQASLNYAQDNGNKLPFLSYLFMRDLYPYLYPGQTAPALVGTEPFPSELFSTIFYCPGMPDRELISARGYAVNDLLSYIDMVEGTNGPEPNKRALALEQVSNPSKTALFGDTHTSSNLSIAFNSAPQWLNARHGHINIGFLSGHVEPVMPDSPQVLNRDGEFWKGRPPN